MNESFLNEYAKTHGWGNLHMPKADVRAHRITSPKKLDTPFQRRQRVCQGEMERLRIKNDRDYVVWMSKKFNPQDENQQKLAHDMAVCLLHKRDNTKKKTTK